MRKVGRIYSLDVSARFLVVFGLFALVFAVVAVLAINQYINLSYQNRELRARVDKLTRSLEEFQFQSQVLSHYNVLVSELNKVEQGKQGKDALPGSQEAAAPAAGNAGSTPSVTEPEPVDDASDRNADEPAGQAEALAAAAPDTPENPPIDVTDFSVDPEKGGKALRFKLSLRNIDPGNKAVAGYLTLVLVNQKDNSAAVATYPEVDIKDGLPADFRKGTQFSISYGKTVRGRIEKLEDAGNFTEGWVFVYSQDGKILLKKNLKADNA